MTDYAVVNPATGETLATYDTFTDAQIEDAVARAASGARTWAATAPADRAVVIRRIDPTSSEWTLRYGVEFVSLDPGLADMLRRILEEDRPAGLEQLWTKAR